MHFFIICVLFKGESPVSQPRKIPLLNETTKQLEVLDLTGKDLPNSYWCLL